MSNNETILKIAEVRKLIKGQKRDKLELLAEELYKMLTKAQKLDNNVADLLLNPGKEAAKAKTRKEDKLRHFDEIKIETIRFIDNAYAQNYLSPNRVVAKKDRPKWRFVAKRLYKELIAHSQQSPNEKEAAELLEKIYVMLCYSCGYILFTAYDPFESVGVAQTEFFDNVFQAIDRVTEKPEMIDKAIDLIVNNSLNRYTLYEELMDIAIMRLATVDMKYLLIEKCKTKREVNTAKNPKSNSIIGKYEYESLLNNFTIMIFKAYASLYETKNGIDDFIAHYRKNDPEIKLYIMVNLLFGYKEKDLILQQLEEARKNSIKLRPGLNNLLDFIKSKNSLPEYIQ
jgi:hypothetical protein